MPCTAEPQGLDTSGAQRKTDAPHPAPPGTPVPKGSAGLPLPPAVGGQQGHRTSIGARRGGRQPRTPLRQRRRLFSPQGWGGDSQCLVEWPRASTSCCSLFLFMVRGRPLTAAAAAAMVTRAGGPGPGNSGLVASLAPLAGHR